MAPHLVTYVREVASCSTICLKPIFTQQVILFYNGRGINHLYKNKNKQKNEVFWYNTFSDVCIRGCMTGSGGGRVSGSSVTSQNCQTVQFSNLPYK